MYTLAGFYAYVCQYNEDNTNDNNVTIPAVSNDNNIEKELYIHCKTKQKKKFRFVQP